MSRNSTKISTDETPGTEVSSQPVGIVDEQAVAAYKSATDGKARAAVRKAVETARDTALRSLDIQAGLNALATLEALKVDQAAKAESVPAHVKLGLRIRSLEEAVTVLRSGKVRPEGLDEVDTEALAAFLAEPLTDEHMVVVVESASKLASAKITRSTESTPSAEYIVRAFDGCEPGTVKTAAQVRRDGKTEDVPLKSPGAIRACMEGNSAPEGYEAVPAVPGKTVWSIRYTG
jgi:hypothetical protein